MNQSRLGVMVLAIIAGAFICALALALWRADWYQAVGHLGGTLLFLCFLFAPHFVLPTPERERPTAASFNQLTGVERISSVALVSALGLFAVQALWGLYRVLAS